MKTLTALLALLALAPSLLAQNLSLTLTNGVDGGAEIPYTPQAIPQSGITVEAWITYDDATIIAGWSHPTLFRQCLGNTCEAYFLRVQAQNIQQTRLSWVVQTQRGTLSWVNWDFVPGQLLPWTHVAATYDGAMQRLFINGVEVASQPGSGMPLVDQGGMLHIGKGDPGSSLSYYEVWNGQIDELRMWPFARTEAEIQSTMNLELVSVPGGVSTWNFNNSDFQDSSSTLSGTAVGTVNFTSNAPALTAIPHPGVNPVGASSPGCLGAIASTIASVPQPGNTAFALVATRFPSGAPVAMIFGAGTVAAPLQVAGIDVWVDLVTPGSFLATAALDTLGTARYPLPIPSWVGPGVLYGTQFIALDACGAMGITASNALGGTIIP